MWLSASICFKMNQFKEKGRQKKTQFLEAGPGNTFQSEGTEQHVDSLQKFTAL